MSTDKRPLKVFLCHAHADRDPVRALYARLTQDGVDAWLDKAKLLPGQDWELEIRKAVREADVVVVCLSKQFNQAGFRQKEVRLALDTAMEKPEGEIFIIPARLEECDTLESLRKWHWVDLFEDDGYEMLMRALYARADKVGMAKFPKDNLHSEPNMVISTYIPEKRTVRAWLVSEKGIIYDVSDGETRIGRSANNDIVLEGDITVPREVAKILFNKERFVFHSLISTNSRFPLVNGFVANKPISLNSEDKIQFGENTILRFWTRRGLPK